MNKRNESFTGTTSNSACACVQYFLALTDSLSEEAAVI